MKILFDNCNFSSASGPNTFATRLAQELSLRGHTIADYNDYDVALVFIEQTRKFSKPVLHRLDGIWFSPEEFNTKNSNIKATYEHATSVVFQSDFDRQMVTKWWGEPKHFSVIRNGINLAKVKSSNETLHEMTQRYNKIFVCSSNWHSQKRLKNNIELFKHIRKNFFPYSCLIVMGSNPDVIDSDRNIYYTGVLPHELCLEIYSVASWMIHLAWLDHCPNVVVEALSQGCPVICSEAGGTAELVKENGIILKEKTQYIFELTNYDSPPSIDVNQIKHIPDINVSCPELDISRVATLYENSLKFCIG